MKSESMDLTRLVEAIAGLRGEIDRLVQRVATLEAAASGTATKKISERTETTAAAPAPPAAARIAPGLSEELVLVIGAAIAAFLGKRPHIRQIRLIGSAAWAQQGRVTIQASHALSVQSVRS
jgi:methylmalonyl-CoA carboxyltransferase large subunit